MGADFERLHPMLQRRFGVGLEPGYACVGTGVMTSIRRGPWWTLPFLYLGKLRNILIPHTGRNVPFVIKNYPYRDPFGRETITFVREYRIRRRPSRFDATMIVDDGRLIDYLGTHQHLAVDLDLQVTDDGALLLTTHGQRFYEGRSASASRCCSVAKRRCTRAMTTTPGSIGSRSRSGTDLRFPVRLRRPVHVRVPAGDRRPGRTQTRPPRTPHLTGCELSVASPA